MKNEKNKILPIIFKTFKNLPKIYFLILVCFFILKNEIKAEDDYQVTILKNPSPGYLKFDWIFKPMFGLVDNYGNYVNNKVTKSGFIYYYMLKNGLISQFCENFYFIYNQDLEVVDSIPKIGNYELNFHDFISLSNGHYLVLCDEKKIMDLSGIVDGGKTNAAIINNIIIETDRTGTIYWQWSSLDHLNITDATTDIDLKSQTIDFAHINSLFEDSNGNILISIRHFDEICLINKETNDFIWRMGGNSSKNNQFIFINDNINGFSGFSHQHTVEILPNGNLLMFDNGNLKSPQYSRVVEYNINLSNKTATKIWEYFNNPLTFTPSMGSAYRLPNGNTLINWSSDKINEIKPDNTIDFELILPLDYPVYRAQKWLIGGIKAATKNITGSGNYNFEDENFNTGVKISVTSTNTVGLTTLQRHSYTPYKSTFTDTTFTSLLNYRYVLNADNGNANIKGTFKISASSLPDISEPSKILVYKRSKECEGVFSELPSTYSQSTGEINVEFTGLGEFVLGTAKLPKPEIIFPVNNSFVDSDFKVQIKKIPTAIQFQIEVSSNSSFSTINYSFSLASPNLLNVSGLMNNSTYYLRLRVINVKDTSVWSDKILINTNVAAPVLTYPQNNFLGLNTKDTLKWNSVEGADSYQIQITFNKDFNNLILNQKNIKLNNFVIEGFANNFEYFWKVRAFKGLDSGKWSEVYSFITKIGTPVLALPIDKSINISNSNEFLWSYINGALYYNFEISTDSSFNFISHSVAKIPQSKFTFDNLEFENKYYWRIKALRINDSSDWSSVFSFKTQLYPTELLSPTQNQKDIAVDVLLTWNKKTSTSNHYRLQIAKDENFNEIVTDSSKIVNEYFLNDELIQKTVYFWRVKVINDKEESPWSEIFSFTTGSGLQMTGPKLIQPKLNSESIPDGLFVWSKKNKAVFYRIQLSEDINFGNYIYNITGLTSSEFNYSNLTVDKEYYWRVKAYSNYDSSQWSSVWNFKIINPDKQITLISPGNEALQVALDGKLEWQEISEIDYYTVQITPDPEFKELLHDVKINDKNYFPYSNLEMNTNYYWRVRYVKNGDISEWSEIWSFSTITSVVLVTPSLTKPLEGMVAVPVSGEIEWTPIKDATEYQISLSNKNNFNTIFLKQTNISENKLKYSDLDYDASYFLRVFASNKQAKSNWSPPINFLTELEPPLITFPLNNTENIPVKCIATWNITKDIYAYQLQFALDAEFKNVVLDFDNIEHLFFPIDLEPLTVYFLRVKNHNDSNYSRWSDTIKFVTENSTAVSDDNSAIQYSVFPNPASEFLYINIDEIDTEFKIEICDIIGRKLISKEIGAGLNVLNIKDLKSGPYFLKINNKSSIFIKD